MKIIQSGYGAAADSVRWLRAKYQRHQEYEDELAANLIERQHSLLREACDWIQREVDNTEVELPDAEDLLVRINREAPAIASAFFRGLSKGDTK